MLADHRVLLYFLLSFLLTPCAFGWGADGHRMIGVLAQEQLTPAAAAAVAALLAGESAPSLDGVATWADDVRSTATSRLHYVNLGPQCSYIPERDCLGRQCIVAAIEDNAALLQSPSATAAARSIALKNLVHFVGDIGMPLHALGMDKGGNKFQLQALGKGTNLHALFDTGLIRSQGGYSSAYLTELRALIGSISQEGFAPFSWAEQSCSVAMSPGFFPSSNVLPDEYVDQWLPVVNRQLAMSAVRLSSILNHVFQTP